MTTPRKPSTRTTAAKVDFDFNTLEVSPDEPMRIRIPGGKVITLISVADLDWQVAAGIFETRNPRDFINAVVSPEDRKAFLAAPITLRQMEAFQDAYLAHFELAAGSPGESDA